MRKGSSLVPLPFTTISPQWLSGAISLRRQLGKSQLVMSGTLHGQMNGVPFSPALARSLIMEDSKF